MRIVLNKNELNTNLGSELLNLLLRIANDGSLSLEEIKELRSWIRKNKEVKINSISYLNDIISRITSDGVIDRDEMLELQLALERVIPTDYRKEIRAARKKIEDARKLRIKEEEKENKRVELLRKNRLRHIFSKVVGVTFPNDNGVERQSIIKTCNVGESLKFYHDTNNPYSSYATMVLRLNGEQLGHLSEHLAEEICSLNADYLSCGVISNLTGGTWDKPTCGVNIIIFLWTPDVTQDELNNYANNVFVEATGYNFNHLPHPCYNYERKNKPWWKFW